MCPAAAAKHLSMSADSLRTIMFRQIAWRAVSMETILGAGNQRHRDALDECGSNGAAHNKPQPGSKYTAVAVGAAGPAAAKLDSWIQGPIVVVVSSTVTATETEPTEPNTGESSNSRAARLVM